MAVHEATPILQHVISALVENQPGVLARVVGLFSARGFNIDSLAVGETDDPTASRITIVVSVDQKTFEQIKKQLNKLIDVIKVQDLTIEGYVDRELMMLKLKTTPKLKELLKTLVGKYHVQILTQGEEVTVVESTESRENTQKLFDIFKDVGILEIARTGTVALSKKQLITQI